MIIKTNKIKSIKKIGKLKTYDLQVKNNHNFILSNNLLSHNSEDYLLMFRTTSWRDKSEMCDELKRERRMLPDQVAGLAFLDKGQAYIAETGRNVIKVQITLPRSAYWKKNYGNFYRNVWENFGGEWTNTEETTDYIENKSKEALDYRISKEPKPKPKVEQKIESVKEKPVVVEPVVSNPLTVEVIEPVKEFKEEIKPVMEIKKRPVCLLK